MKKRLALLIAAVLAGVPLLLLTAQDAPTLTITGVNASKLPTTIITTTVIDATGRSVPGLTAADFELSGVFSEFGRVVNVETTTDEDVSFAVVLVIDVSSSMAGRPFELTQAAARQFVDGLGPNDPVAIIVFSSRVRQVLDFTTDKDLIKRTIDQLHFGGQTALYEGVTAGVELAAAAPVERRAVVVLSDGFQFGVQTEITPNTPIELARTKGVSVYTIGLGWGTDRPYLERLARETNGTYSESPTPDELSAIYTGLAALFRNQYIVTVEADVPLDGTEYPFGLRANTPQGTTNIAESVVRAPVPVPVIFFPDLAEPIAEITTITPEIRADDGIASVTADLDGVSLTVVEGGVTIDPVQFPPGSYTLTFSATDREGDTGTASTTLTITALPTPITITLTPATLVLDGPVVATVTGEGQTELVQVTYAVDGQTVVSDDAANNFPFLVDPFTLPVGEITLSAVALNAGGVTSEAELRLLIAPVPPVVTVEGVVDGQTVTEPLTLSATATTQSGAELREATVTIGDQTFPLPFTLDPADFPPGPLTLTITTTDSNDQTATQTITVEIPNLGIAAAVDPAFTGEVTAPTEIPITVDTQTEIVSVMVTVNGRMFTVEPRDNVIPLVIDPQEIGVNGDFLALVMITDASGNTTVVEVPFTVSGIPTPTPTPTNTFTPTATFTPSNTPTVTNTPVPPTDTVTPEPPIDTPVPPTDTVTPEPPTDTPVPPTDTVTPEPVTDAVTPEATPAVVAVVPTDTPTPRVAVDTPTATSTATATNTPVPPTATETPDRNATGTAVAVAATSTAEFRTTSTAVVLATQTAVAGATATRVEFLARASATAEANQQATATAVQNALLQATANAAITQTAQSVQATTAARIVTATAQAQATATAQAQATRDAQATSTADARATLNAQATTDAQATNTAIAEATSLAQLNATQTAEAVPSDTPIPPTLEVTPETTVEATEEASPTVEVVATLTPVPGLQQGGDQPPPPQIDVLPYVVCGGAALLLVLLLFLLSRTRREA